MLYTQPPLFHDKSVLVLNVLKSALNCELFYIYLGLLPTTVSVWNPNLYGFQTLNNCSGFQIVRISDRFFILWSCYIQCVCTWIAMVLCVWNPNYLKTELWKVLISDIYWTLVFASKNLLVSTNKKKTCAIWKKFLCLKIG